MITTKKLLNLDDPLVLVKQSCDKVELVSSTYTYYQIDKLSFKVQKKAVIEKDALGHQFLKKFDISNDNLGVYPKKSSNTTVFIKDNQGLKIVANLVLPEATSITKFSNSAKMLLLGGYNGDIWLYDVDMKKVTYTFLPRSDEISSIVFSHDDSLVAIGSFDKKILIHDCATWDVVASIECQSVPEDIVFSNDKEHLYFVQRDGVICAYHVADKNKIYSKTFSDQWFSVIKTYKSDNFAIVGARSNILMLLDLKSGKVLKNISLQNSGINSIDFSEEDFFAVFADGGFLVCDMKKHKVEAGVAIKLKDYEKAKELIDKNVFLYLDGTIDELYDHWDEVLKKVIMLIELGEIEEAVTLATPFLENEEFNEEFSSYMSQKEEIALFIQSVNTKHYAKAYQSVNECEYIEKLKKYQELEELWYQSFNNAKKIIEKNPNNSGAIIRAKGAMQSFLNVVPKKETIENLLKNSKLFFQADTLVREKKFGQFFMLCENNKFLEDTKIFHKVMSVSTLLLSNITKAISKKEYDNALLLANRLLEFTPIKEEVQKKIKEITVIKSFNEVLKDQNLFAIFALVKSNKFLESSLEFSNLMDDFNQVNEKAKRYALSGELEIVFETLDEYIKIDYLKDRVAFTMRLGYLNSIAPALEDGKINWEKTLTNYMQMYGKDEDLKNIALQYEVIDIFNSIKHDEEKKSKKIKFKEKIVVT